MVTLRQTEDLSLPRSARSYIDSCASEFQNTDAYTKIAEIAYRVKRGADLLPVFIEDINQHMEHPAYGTYEDIAKRSIAGYIDILRTGKRYSLATQTKKTFLILRSEELWKETLGEGLWGQLEANGRIIAKGHKGISQHITRGNIKKDNGYDKLVNILFPTYICLKRSTPFYKATAS